MRWLLPVAVAVWCVAWTAEAGVGPYLAVERVGVCHIELPPQATRTALTILRYWDGMVTARRLLDVVYGEINRELVDREDLTGRIERCRR